MMNDKTKTRMISVTGGKGGVGKTFFSINLALQLAQEGFRTCLFDADLGLSNIDVMLGLNPDRNLQDLFAKQLSLSDIMIRNHLGIDIIPGGSGIEQLAQLPPDAMDHLLRSFRELDSYDFVIFDTAAGIAKNVVSFCLSSPELIMVITPEPTSITDAYALLKVLALNGLQAKVLVVFNQIKKVAIAKKAYQLFDEAVLKHLHLKIKPLGFVFQDLKVQEAIRERRAFLSAFPGSRAAACFKQLAANLIKADSPGAAPGGIEAFWKNYLHAVQNKSLIFEPPETQPLNDEGLVFFDVTQGVHFHENPLAPDENKTREPSAVAKEESPPPVVVAVDTAETPEDLSAQTDPKPPDPSVELIQVVRALTDELKQLRMVLQHHLDRNAITTAHAHRSPTLNREPKNFEPE